ncbi:hypothetical protein [Thiohalocapsa halophila]|uniref:hypothetical protein n=1 Tax=Thiohalocapsa halophila TaxID=69359 RepID=UPI0019078B2B|nr:hypothetical protein [Thiohalocapsa halophila]
MTQSEEDKLEVMKIALEEGRKGLADQDKTINSIRQRSMWIGGLAGVIAAFLGREALDVSPIANLTLCVDSIALVVGFAALFVTYAAIINVMRPHKGLKFHNSPGLVISQFTDPENPATLTEIHEALAGFSEENYICNQKILSRLFLSLLVAAIAMIVEFIAWLTVLA